MRRLVQLVASAAISLSLVANSTAAAAYTPPTAPSTNGWLTLSMLTPSGAAVLGAAPAVTACAAVGATAAAVTAAQPTGGCVLPQVGAVPAGVETPPPPPPPPPVTGGPGFPPIPVILIWLAVLGVDIWILTRHHHHGLPNSPA